MQAKKRRFLALLLSVLLIACQPVWAAAVEGPAAAEDVAESFDTYESVPIYVQSYEGTANGTGSLYNTLTARQKAAYNALKNISWSRIASSGNHQVQVNVQGINGTPITGYSSGGYFHASGSGVKTYQDIQNDVNAAIAALRYDRPDMLWLDGTVSHYYSFIGYNSTGRYNISSFSFGFPYTYGGQENILRERLMAEARSIAAAAGREKDMYSKVKYVHDRLAERSSYNYAATEPSGVSEYEFRMAHNAYGGMFKDQYEPVCEGYAKALKIVLNQMDIPCVLAVSDGHMWNNVKMDDGLWYNLDLTWDDSGDRIKYDYFLVGSGTKIGSETFASSHREVDPFDNNRVSGARYPKKNSVEYKYLGEDYPKTTYPDVPRSDYAYEYVEKVSKLGYFTGDNNGYFNPGKNINRAEFATVMAKAMGVDLTVYKGVYSFSDVGVTKWYAAAACWARESGLMVGNGVRFRPEAPISRQEMCSVLSRALNLDGVQSGGFTDDRSIDGWAREGVYACYAAGLVTGSTSGSFNPKGSTSRRDAAVVFARYADRVGAVPSGEQ